MRTRSVVYVASALVASTLAGVVPVGAAAHDATKTGAAHFNEDAVTMTFAEEKRLELRTMEATAADAEAAAGTGAEDPAEVGAWGPVVDWPVVGIHMALLANGKVLAYDSVGDLHGGHYEDHSSTRGTVWDPATGVHAAAMVSGFNIFCSGLAHLMDGTVFTAGGNKNSNAEGIVQTHTFDAATTTWSRGADMAVERWYPTVTPLRDGEMLITEGDQDGSNTPEVRELDGDFRYLSDAERGLPLYPWIDVAPDGRAFYSGPTTTMRSLDPSGTGEWETFGQRDGVPRGYGSHVVYDIGKILVAGGGLGDTPEGSTTSATVININGQTPHASPTDEMESARRQHNLTVLADGTVLATGGNSSGAPLVDVDAGVYPAELWDPDTGQWTTLASMQVTRQYHSTALLLPDGRVLSAGGGVCGTCEQQGYLAKNAEVFTPPYLFKDDASGELAPRPQITGAPDVVDYDEPFEVATPDAATLAKVAMVRLGAVTHSVNMEQRYVPLTFSAGGEGIEADAPASPNIAPPGVYMLFVIGANGAPSVAEMVRIEQIPEDSTAPDTQITDGPPKRTTKRKVKFEFTSTEPGSSFRCSMDDGRFARCSSPERARVGLGSHVFRVRATDSAKNTDPTPAKRGFRVVR